MEIERPELRADGGASSSSVARYLSDAGLSRTHSYTGCEDLELEIRCRHLREIADRIELAHSRMLNEHDRRALAIAEQAPYARFIPFYPELPSENGQINHTAQLAPCTRSPQRGAPMYQKVPGEKGKVQIDLNPGLRRGPWVPSLLGREVVVPHAEVRFLPEPRNGSGSLCQPVEPVETVCATGLVQDVCIDNRPVHDPILQNQFTGYNIMFPPQVMHEPPPSLVVPVLVPVPIIEKIESSVDKKKKRKKAYGNEVIQVKPTMQWSKWPCVWCSVNFDSKEAMDAHLQEQHQGCQGDGASETEKVEKRSEEARTGLAVTSDGNQMEISEVSEPHASKKIHLDLSPSNIKQKHDEVNKDEVVPVLENKENIGSNTSKKMKLVVPPLNLKRKSDKHNKEEVIPTPEKEIASSHADKKIKLDLPPSKRKPDEVTGEEFVQSPQNKEIASSDINRKMKLDFPSSNSKQKSDEPSKEKVVRTSESKEIAGSSNNKKTKLDLPILNLEKKSVNAVLNGSQKSNSTNRMVTEKPVQGACQAESVPKLEGPKETRKDPSKEEVVRTPESIEIAGFSNNTRGSCANPSKPDEPSKEEVMPTPENREIAGFNNNIKVQVDLPTSNLEQKSAKPNKALSTPRNKEINGSSIQSTISTRHKKIESSVDKNKKRKKEYGNEVIQVKPTKQWSKWPCVWCSVNFDSKVAMDAHLQEQHQGCKGDGPSESEKVEKNRSDEAITGLSVTSDGNQMEIFEVSKPHANSKIYLDLPLSNTKQKHDKVNKDEVVPVLENKENIGSNTSKKMKLVVPPLNLKRKCDKPDKEEVLPTPENKEIAGCDTNKKIKLDFPPSNLIKKPDEVMGEEFVQSPHNKEIAGSDINRKMKLDFPSSNSKQKSDEPSKEKVVPTPKSKEIAGSSNNKKTKLDLPTLNLEKKSVKAPQNGSQKSNSPNRMTEKPVQGVSQGASVPKLGGPKGTHKDPSKEETVQTPENKEIAGFSNNTRGSHANPRKPDEPSKETVVPTPENKEIAGFSNNIKVQLDLPTSNLEQESLKPNKVLLTPGNKETAGSGIKSTSPTGHKKPVIGTTTERTLDKHFQSNGNNQKLKALLNESHKSKPANRVMTEKFVQGVSQAASMPKLEDPKEVTSKSVTLPKPVQGASQAASAPKLEDPKEETSKSVAMPKPVQGASQAASSPKLVKPKEETSKLIPMPQANKLKEVTSQDNENRSSKSKTVILSGHRKTSQTTAEFSEKKNYISVNGTTMPMLVMKDGKWFCNLCQATWMTERCKDEHINGKRHWLNLQAQDVSCRSEPAEPVMVMTDGTTKPVLVMTDGNWFCNLCKTKQMSEKVKEQHINSKKHKQNLEAQAVSYRPEFAKPPARLQWCFICNVICTSEDNLIAHYNGKQHREVLMKGFRGAS